MTTATGYGGTGLPDPALLDIVENGIGSGGWPLVRPQERIGPKSTDVSTMTVLVVAIGSG